MDQETAANLYEEEAAECFSIIKHPQNYAPHDIPPEFFEELAASHLSDANACRGYAAL